jgi:hypothetical protein
MKKRNVDTSIKQAQKQHNCPVLLSNPLLQGVYASL